MKDHQFAIRKKIFWTEKAKGLGGIMNPIYNLSAHNWIRNEIRMRTNIQNIADEMISDSQLYKDLDNGRSKKTA